MARLSRQTKRWQAINWLLTAAICFGPAHTTLAQPVYKVTDADGDVTFTDTPPLSSGGTSEEHAVHAPNTAKPTETTRAPATPFEVEEPIRQLVALLVSPKPSPQPLTSLVPHFQGHL